MDVLDKFYKNTKRISPMKQGDQEFLLHFERDCSQGCSNGYEWFETEEELRYHVKTRQLKVIEAYEIPYARDLEF